MDIDRFYETKINGLLKKGKVLVVYGPRQVGKTTMIQKFITTFKGKVYSSSGENSDLYAILSSQSFSKIIPYFADYDLIFIDEAQKIENVGTYLKILVDQLPQKYVIATGSSSFELGNKLGEPLVGRENVIRLYPISIGELQKQFGNAYIFDNLENFMIFGSYPEIFKQKGILSKINYLSQIRDSYLYKDILLFENISNSKKILDILRLLAFQIGSEVSILEIAKQVELSKNTVAKYLDLLEKAFVIINIRGYSKNLRKEITKMSKYYFYDNGIRNAIIGNFNIIKERNDAGQLWENLMIIERIKKQQYQKKHTNNFFWRTWNQQEIDFVEERDGKLFGYEFKWGNNIPSIPPLWKNTYPDAKYSVINKDNFLPFVC